jgi:hypothetical protein
VRKEREGEVMNEVERAEGEGRREGKVTDKKEKKRAGCSVPYGYHHY